MQRNYSVEYRSAEKLSRIVTGLLAAIAVTEGIQTIFSLGQLYFPYTVELGTGEISSFWITATGALAVLQIPINILTVVFFLIWLHRAYKNLIPLRAGPLEHSAGWAVGYWFIPFVNLVKPFQVVREVWNESDPDFDPEAGFLSGSAGTPALLGVWWALWLVSNIASNISFQLDMAGKGVEEPASVTVFGVASLFNMFAAIAAFMVVKGITARQVERFTKVGSYSFYSEPPPPPSFA